MSRDERHGLIDDLLIWVVMGFQISRFQRFVVVVLHSLVVLLGCDLHTGVLRHRCIVYIVNLDISKMQNITTWK